MLFAIFYYITNQKAIASRFRRDHPLLSLTVIFTGGYFIMLMLGSVLVFLFGICLPLLGKSTPTPGAGQWGRMEKTGSNLHLVPSMVFAFIIA